MQVNKLLHQLKNTKEEVFAMHHINQNQEINMIYSTKKDKLTISPLNMMLLKAHHKFQVVANQMICRALAYFLVFNNPPKVLKCFHLSSKGMNSTFNHL
jgi:hypothetical protein